jgi:hypothetical protein
MAQTTEPRSPPYDLWEYKMLVLGGPAPFGVLEDQLNQLGAEGWEMVGADGFHVFFKRPAYSATQGPLRRP